MKRISILTIGILLINTLSIIAQNKNALVVKEISYGESKAEKIYESKMRKSPSGHHNGETEKLNIIKRTDKIEAKLGKQFGIEYELISDKDEASLIEITWVYPKGMKDQNGKDIKESTYEILKPTNEYTYSNYTLEGENELVKGQWIFIISKNGKELYRKIFWLI